jgi:hypothetical protein
MFNGPYLILSVEHSISPGTFKTNFTGVRQSKYSFPAVTNFLQHIYKTYFSKVVQDVRNDISKEISESRNSSSVNVDDITDRTQKSRALSDCTPTDANNAKNYQLTNKDDLLNINSKSISDIVRLVGTAGDARIRLLVFSTIYFNSYDNGTFKYYGNNLLGFGLDDPIKGGLAGYLTKEYICLNKNNDKVPLAIFKTIEGSVSFGKDYFKTSSLAMRGKIDTLAEQTFRIYLKFWTNKTDTEITDLSTTPEYAEALKTFEAANKLFVTVFPDDSKKTF